VIPRNPQRPPVVLTVAGTDSGGGAGVAADLKTFAVLGVHGACAVAAVTAQNSVEVAEVFPLPPELVAAQIRAVVTDLGCAALKTGMLATAANVEAVYQAVQEYHLPHLVVDPVMVATSGALLLEPEAQAAYRELLLPVAEVITPNLPEAEALLGRRIAGAEEMAQAARDLCAFGCRAALITGGHLEGEALDVLYEARADRAHFLSQPRLDTRNTHGSGCVFSAALAAYLARGESLLGAATGAKAFVTRALVAALELGAGPGAVNPLFNLSQGETEP
jgi:hydroxymethylpyrimidine kinase/phosphomethylpyrimidine kinase